MGHWGETNSAARSLWCLTVSAWDKDQLPNPFAHRQKVWCRWVCNSLPPLLVHSNYLGILRYAHISLFSSLERSVHVPRYNNDFIGGYTQAWCSVASLSSASATMKRVLMLPQPPIVSRQTFTCFARQILEGLSNMYHTNNTAHQQPCSRMIRGIPYMFPEQKDRCVLMKDVVNVISTDMAECSGQKRNRWEMRLCSESEWEGGGQRCSQSGYLSACIASSAICITILTALDAWSAFCSVLNSLHANVSR